MDMGSEISLNLLYVLPPPNGGMAYSLSNATRLTSREQPAL